MDNPLDPCHRLPEKIWNTFIRYRWLRRRAPIIKYWANQKEGDNHSFDKYIECNEACEILVNEIAYRSTSKFDRILDVGCNVGRHLNALQNRGFSELHGIDVGSEAIAAMPKIFPHLANSVNVECQSFEKYFPRIQDQHFGITFTSGATFELVHPSFRICQEMARVTSRHCILAIFEGDHSYPRLWSYEFWRSGFLLVKLLRPMLTGTSISLMVFERK